MKKNPLLILFLLVFILSACNKPTPTPVVPTQAPTQEPTVAPTEAPVEATPEAPAIFGRTFGEAWESVPCDTFQVAPEVAAIADCGYVTVPENRATGSDKQIKLAVVRVKSTNENPGAPLVLGTGGPGGGGLGNVQGSAGSGFPTTYGPILQDRDFVLFSQRGTALAQPTLDCPAYNNLTFEASAKGMSLEERGQAVRDALVTCAEAFKAEGVDLAAYNYQRERRRRRRHPPGPGLRQDLLLRRVLRHPVGPVRPAPPPRHPGGDPARRHRADHKREVRAGQRYPGRLPDGLRGLRGRCDVQRCVSGHRVHARRDHGPAA